MHKYLRILLARIEREIDPAFMITYRVGLEDAPAVYRTFRDKDDSCMNPIPQEPEKEIRRG
jgi:threonine dehydrogenase-like Zn-dependent dehydrogenase